MTMRNSNLTAAYIATVNQQAPIQLLADGNYRTGPVRLCFPQLHEAKAQDAEKPNDKKFSAMFLFPPGADLGVLVNAANAAAQAEWPNMGQAGGPNPATIEMPWNDQAIKSQFEPFEAGSWFINCKSGNMPFLSNTAGAPIPNVEEKFYPGCWVLALIRPFAWNHRNPAGAVIKRGVSFGLQGAIFLCDDNRLGGGGVDQQGAIVGLGALAGLGGIDQGVNPQALFAGAGGPGGPGAPAAPIAAAPAMPGPGPMSPGGPIPAASPAGPGLTAQTPASPSSPAAPQPVLNPVTGQWELPQPGGAVSPPSAPPAPPPAPPPAVATKQLLPHAQGTYQQYIDIGWDDAQLIAQGLMAAS